MTLNEFLRALRQTKRDWYLTDHGEIRRDRHGACECPEVALRLNPADFSVVHPGLIWSAADNELDHDKKLRKRLLKACGLS